jgi:hypothetical protein
MRDLAFTPVRKALTPAHARGLSTSLLLATLLALGLLVHAQYAGPAASPTDASPTLRPPNALYASAPSLKEPSAVAHLNADEAQQAAYDLSWWTVDAGGTTFSTGGTYTLGATVGQPDAGAMTGGDFTLSGGFWSGAAVQHTIYLPLLLRGG